MTTDEARNDLRRARITHLESLIADLDHDWQRIPKLAWLCLLAIPIALRSGFVWGLVAVACVGCLAGVVMYILRVRRQEYARDRDGILRDISRSSLGEPPR